MTEAEIRWGILGCGDVTEVKSGPALQKAGRSSVVAVMRRDGVKAKDYAARHGVDVWYDDAQALIDDDNVNAIYIATPPSSHCELTLKALAAGKPVLVEKPMALDSAECDTMIAAAEKAEQSLIVAFYRRALPRFEKMRQLIQDGAIGTPRLAQITHFTVRAGRPDVDWKVDPAMGGGGMFFDTQSHALDWLNYTFGSPINIQGMTARQAGDYLAEDFVAFTGQFGDVAVTATCAYAIGEAREDMIVYGEKGSIKMSFFSHSPIVLTIDGQEEIIDIADPDHMHQPLIEAIVAHLLDGKPNPCSGADARQVNAVLAEIYTG